MAVIKIISLNLWNGGILFNKILDFLNQEQPDILLAQEVLEGDNPQLPERFQSIETIQKSCQFLDVRFAPAFIDNLEDIKVTSGNAIFSRLPITAHQVISYGQPFGERTEWNPLAFALTPRNLQHAVIKMDDIQLNIFNTQGIWDLDGENVSKERLEMCQTIARAVRDQSHVVLAGDFNLNPINVALKSIDNELESVFKHELATSFNARRKDLKKYPGFATAVVDLMYISRDLKVVAYSCPDVDISDHLPLVATLELSQLSKA